MCRDTMGGQHPPRAEQGVPRAFYRARSSPFRAASASPSASPLRMLGRPRHGTGRAATTRPRRRQRARRTPGTGRLAARATPAAGKTSSCASRRRPTRSAEARTASATAGSTRGRTRAGSRARARAARRRAAPAATRHGTEILEARHGRRSFFDTHVVGRKRVCTSTPQACVATKWGISTSTERSTATTMTAGDTKRRRFAATQPAPRSSDQTDHRQAPVRSYAGRQDAESFPSHSRAARAASSELV
jgi:hypothetical protein